MDKFIIKGGTPLHGEVQISGAKNAVLPIIAATILTSDPVTIRNVPDLVDVHTMLHLLKAMGSKIKIEDNMDLHIDNSNLSKFEADYKLVQTMRASILALGPLVSRFKQAKVSLPGGCAIGARPVNFHIAGLKAMGAKIHIKDGYIYAQAEKLHGAPCFFFNTVSVTGTQNLIMAATLAQGKTVLENAACEPEVVDLVNLLKKMGAKISGAGTSTIIIEGVAKLNGAEHKVIPDRIETGTFLVAAAITKGKVKALQTDDRLLETLLVKLINAGVKISVGDNWIEADATNANLKAVSFSTEPHPAFPTDMQSQFMVLNCIAKGSAQITENIFENRFMHVPELQRMGAQLTIRGHTVTSEHVENLKAAPVMATDLRASAGLVLAALIAVGESTIRRIYHIDRGYQHFEQKLKSLGASIKRVS